VLKPFFNKTGNRFVETGNLPVIRLHDVMRHVAAVLERKAADEVKRGYIITMSTVCVNWPVVYTVQCNQTLSQLSNLGWLPRSAVASC